MTYRIPTQLPKDIFRTYDIRGEVSEISLNENVAYAIGLAVATDAKAQQQTSVIVANDMRLTSESLKKALIAGLTEAGCDVIDIGLGPTPMMYFATHYLPTKTGVMVTASHNPAHHNGFKIVLNGKTLSEQGIQEIAKRIETRDFACGVVDESLRHKAHDFACGAADESLRHKAHDFACGAAGASPRQGSVTKENVIPAYINAICEKLTLKKPMKVVIDAGNGAASNIAPQVFRKLGCDVIELFCQYDGRFPNHHPDPTVPENLKTIIETVKKEKADIGLAFDGDADRLGVVTNTGEIIWPDRQLMLFAKDVLSRHPGEKIIFDVKCSRALSDLIKQCGGKPIMWRTGHSITKAKMIAENALLAGEMSGHIFFKDDWYGFDDGIYVGARLLSVLSREAGSVADVFDALPKMINTPEIKLPMAENKKVDFMRALSEKGEFLGATKITIDGLRVEWDFGWGLIRPSNTSAYLILRFEADTKNNLEKIQHLFRVQLLKIDHELQLPF